MPNSESGTGALEINDTALSFQEAQNPMWGLDVHTYRLRGKATVADGCGRTGQFCKGWHGEGSEDT